MRHKKRGEVAAHRTLSGKAGPEGARQFSRACCASTEREGTARTKVVPRSRVLSLRVGSTWVSSAILVWLAVWSSSSTSSGTSIMTSTSAASSSGTSPASSSRSRRSSESGAQYWVTVTPLQRATSLQGLCSESRLGKVVSRPIWTLASMTWVGNRAFIFAASALAPSVLSRRSIGIHSSRKTA